MIINSKKIGNIQDVKFVLENLKIELPKEYLDFLYSCEYRLIKKDNEEIILYDPLTIIHENSIDILSKSNEKLDFLCIGKFKGTERYLIIKEVNLIIGIYDNMDCTDKILYNSLKEVE